MNHLATASAAHLGEALVCTPKAAGHAAIGLDVLPSEFTHGVGSITDRALVAQCMRGVNSVLHSVSNGHDPRSALAREIGAKGYHRS